MIPWSLAGGVSCVLLNSPGIPRTHQEKTAEAQGSAATPIFLSSVYESRAVTGWALWSAPLTLYSSYLCYYTEGSTNDGYSIHLSHPLFSVFWGDLMVNVNFLTREPTGGQPQSPAEHFTTAALLLAQNHWTLWGGKCSSPRFTHKIENPNLKSRT